MIEVEQPEGISARKLILEAARHNVITAYTASVGIQLLGRFPNVDAVVIHTEVGDSTFEETVRQVKTQRPDLFVIGITPLANRNHDGADHMLFSYEPEALLSLLADRFHSETGVRPPRR